MGGPVALSDIHATKDFFQGVLRAVHAWRGRAQLAFDVRMRCGPKTISIAHVYTPSRSVTGCFGGCGVRSSHSNTSWNSLLLRKGVRDFQPLAIPQQQKEKGYANDRHVSDKFDKRGFVVALGNEDNV